MNYSPIETISLRNHPDINERWVQDVISKNVHLLGLGDVMIRDRERTQASNGRLDFLLQDRFGAKRYEVEIQLGKTDESHIIRTIEYWDMEVRRFPQYEHIAVIVAEDITSRFLNVISLFNGKIPIIALQMNAIKTPSGIGLSFTRIVDAYRFGIEHGVDSQVEDSDRLHWIKAIGEEAMAAFDIFFGYVNEVDPDLVPIYRKGHVAVSRCGTAAKFLIINPRKRFVAMNVKLPRDDSIESTCAQSGMRCRRWGDSYEIRIPRDCITSARDFVTSLLRRSYDALEG